MRIDSAFAQHIREIATHRFLVAAATVAAFAIPAATVAKDALLHMTHYWHVSLDSSGKVTALVNEGKLEPAVREALERAIRGWAFVPGKIGGIPAPTETGLTLDVTFLPAADGNYSVRIDDARTGGSFAADAKRQAPRFPRDMVRSGFAGRVVVKADYDADGNIVRVTPQDDQGFNASRSLDAATIKAVQQWKVTPERVAGHGVAASIMVPVCYIIADTRRPPDFACAWTPPGSKSKVDDGNAFALAPTAKLSTEVIGRTL